MTSTDIAHPAAGEVTTGSAGALALRAEQTQWTPEQEAALTQIGLAQASDADRLVFLHVAQRAGLDPFARQIYMIGRSDNAAPGGTKWTIQTGIDGFRVIAERHPQYAGQTSPQWCGEDGVWKEVWLDSKKSPSAARVGVLRHDRAEPVYATCIFTEFAQYKNGGGLNSMWSTKGAHMIAKCAEAGALRKAFPQDVAGLVTDDEAHGLDRQTRTARVQSTRDTGAVDVSELTGQPAAPTEPTRRAPSTAPRAAPPLEGGSKRATSKHTTRLMAALRKAEGLEDSKAWATAVLGLPQSLTSWGPLTCDQANTLIEKLEAGDIGVIDATPATAPDPADDQDVEDAYRDIEADRDAAQGTLDGQADQ